jgi:hypothetical protein
VSLIGSLEQFDLANILRRLEVFSKTGLLVIKQGDLWVEFYFRQGQLVCIGPVRSKATLVGRFMQANLLSPQALPQIKETIGAAGSNETQIAVALINAGFLTRETLRTWFAQEASQILQAIFTWQIGEIYFEDDCPTPVDRLLVALSVSQLLDAMPTPAVSLSTARPASVVAPSTDDHARTSSSLPPDTERLRQVNVAPLVENAAQFSSAGFLNAAQLIEQPPAFDAPSAPSGVAATSTGLLNASQLIDDSPFDLSGSLDLAQFVAPTPPTVSFASVAPSVSFASIAPSKGLFGSEIEVAAPAQVSLMPPQPVRNPLPPPRVDTSFMTPELVLVSVDLSALRERNPQVQLTPDQWRLFALIDGHFSLQELCQMLMVSSEVVCNLAGELIAIGLVMPLTQTMSSMSEFAQTGAQNVLAQPSPYAVQPNWPPQSQMSGPMSFVGPMETQASWGKGYNGANVMVGGSWVVSSQQEPMQFGQPSGAFVFQSR